MDVTVPKKELLRLVGRCQGVADKKSTMPALSNVLLNVSGPSELRVSATDLYLAVSGTVSGVEIKKGGSVAVPAKDLYERIKMMPEGPIHVVTSDGFSTTLKAAASARRYTLRGMPGEDFPALAEPDPKSASLELELELLGKLIARTHFSISTDETRAALNSALFEWDGDRVRMVTTDGHRLSKMELRVAGRQATATMLLPLKAIGELRRLGDEARAEAGKDGEAQRVTIAQSGPNAFFGIGGTRFSVKLVDAQFPPYSQVIPQTSDRAIRAPRAAFADALRAVSLAASDRTGGVKLEVTSGAMRITSESPETGDGFDEIPVDYAGAEVVIGFNAKYFLDVLGAIDDEEVVLGIGGDLDPAVIRPATESDEQSYKAVVMPMRI
ncbi:MAG TPA: DNA polymerase III subunit beta [Polyangiaceae bacterium]|nr:DNA polymerase III subunit beta [Polyangiaceae bacterium]